MNTSKSSDIQKEKFRIYSKEYYNLHKEKIKEKRRIKWQNRSLTKEEYLAYREKMNAYQKQYRLKKIKEEFSFIFGSQQ